MWLALASLETIFEICDRGVLCCVASRRFVLQRIVLCIRSNRCATSPFWLLASGATPSDPNETHVLSVIHGTLEYRATERKAYARNRRAPAREQYLLTAAQPSRRSRCAPRPSLGSGANHRVGCGSERTPSVTCSSVGEKSCAPSSLAIICRTAAVNVDMGPSSLPCVPNVRDGMVACRKPLDLSQLTWPVLEP